jgi:hypothetical protein
VVEMIAEACELNRRAGSRGSPVLSDGEGFLDMLRTRVNQPGVVPRTDGGARRDFLREPEVYFRYLLAE